MKTDIKELAKEFYFAQVKNSKYRANFVESLNEKEVIDKHEQGYYCCHCCDFMKSPMAFVQENKTIFPLKESNQLWIVNTHYDGCRGWD